MLDFVADTLAHFPDEKEEPDSSSRLLYLTARQSPAKLDASQRRSSWRQQYCRVHTQELNVEVCFHHLVILVLK